MKKRIALAALAAAFAVPAFAQQRAFPAQRLYLTASGGWSRTGDDLVSNTESAILGADNVHSDFDRQDGAWKFGGGYRVLPWLAVELDYADLGRAKVHTSMTASGAPAGLAIDRKVDGWGVDAVFSWPVAPAWVLYARAGAFRSHVETSQALAGNIVFGDTDPLVRSRSFTHSESVARGGVGARWRAWRNGGIHLEYEHYDQVGQAFEVGKTHATGRADIDALWIGVTQSF